jgi:hypothetical protein
MATVIRKTQKLQTLLSLLEKRTGTDPALIAELQALLYGAGWHTIR